ncbi:MAG: hypothetical protein WA956_06895 [Stenotrophomonas sp.]
MNICMRAVLSAAMVFLPGYLLAEEFASGTRVSFNEHSGRVVMEAATIKASGRMEASSDLAEYRVEEMGDPRVVDLKGNVRVTAGGQLVLTDAATLYPHISVLTADTISLADMDGAKSAVTYTCSNGQLKADGVPVEGNSACHGKMLITCGGQGGNQVEVIFLVEDCPLQ